MSVSLAPNWAEHFHKTNGELAAGYKVYVFESRTEDYKASYSDPEGQELHSQPIMLNSRGEYPGMGLYLLDGEAYTLELRTDAGVTLKTAHDVVSINTAASAKIVLPAHTVYGNTSAGSTAGFPVAIASSISGAEDDSLPDVAAINEALESYLPNSGDNTYNGNLIITESLTAGSVQTTSISADDISLDGVALEDLFVPKAGHDARSLVGNSGTSIGNVADIPLENDLSSNSTGAVPSVKAVSDAIAEALGNVPGGDTYQVKTVIADNNPGYLFEKLQAGDGVTLETDGDLITISAGASSTPPDAFQSKTTDSVIWNKRMPDVVGQTSPFKYWWTTSSGSQLEQNPVTCSQWDNSAKIFTADSDGLWLFSAGRDGSPTNANKDYVSQYAIVRLTTSNSGDVYPVSNEGSVTVVLNLVAGDRVFFGVHSTDGSTTQPISCGTYSFAGHSLELAGGAASGAKSKRCIYVSNNGSDSNTGFNAASAKLTLAAAASAAYAASVSEGLNLEWTVVCEDNSEFTAVSSTIPPGIGLYMPLAKITASTFFAVSEGCSYALGELITDFFYTFNGLITPTNISIGAVTLRDSSGLGVYAGGSTSEKITVAVKTIVLTAPTFSGYGILASVGGDSSRHLTFNVDQINFAGTCPDDKTVSHAVFNNNGATLVTNLGVIDAPNLNSLVMSSSTGPVIVNVKKSNTRELVYLAGEGVQVTVQGGILGGNIGRYTYSPKLTIDGSLAATQGIINMNADPGVVGDIRISSHGMISVGGSDLPGYLIDKLEAGSNITLTKTVDNTIRITAIDTSGGVTAHNDLDGRDQPGCHVIGATEGLNEALADKVSKTSSTAQSIKSTIYLDSDDGTDQTQITLNGGAGGFSRIDVGSATGYAAINAQSGSSPYLTITYDEHGRVDLNPQQLQFTDPDGHLSSISSTDVRIQDKSVLTDHIVEVATDGLTVTGNGTAASPLVAHASGATAYVHTQDYAVNTWAINHGFSYFPIIQCWNSSGQVVEGAITHYEGYSTVYFAVGQSGGARCI